jgi:hypothetical protein
MDLSANKTYSNQLLIPTWLFGLCFLLHGVSGFDYEVKGSALKDSYIWLESAIIFCALSLVFRPNWLMPLIAVSVLCLFKYLQPYDYNSNSVFLIFMVSLVFLFGHLSAFISHVLGRLALEETREQGARYILSGLRALLVVMYFYGIFHKINIDWFNLDEGCAVRWWEKIHPSFLASLLDYTSFKMFIIWAPLVLEFIFMVGLFTKGGLKYIAMVGGVFFHLFIGFSLFRYYWGFSSAVLILYSAFLSADFLPKCREFLTKETLKFLVSNTYMRFALSLLSLLLLTGLLYIAKVGAQEFMTITLVLWSFFSIVVVGLVAVFCYDAHVGKFFYGADYKHLISRSFLVNAVVVFYFVHSAFPYLGLNTVPTLTMFSNLYTEDGRSNHYIIPVKSQIFDWQRDVAVVSKSGIRDVGRKTRHSTESKIPIKDLLKYMRHYPKKPTSFEYQGQNYKNVVYDDVRNLSTLWPKFLDALFSFKRIDTRAPGRCTG